MIEKSIRRGPLHKMFTDVPPRYDLINRLFTLGMDGKWRRKAAIDCLASKPERVLDLCCGTGDLAIDITRLASYHIDITGIDFSERMLDLARLKAESATQKIKFTIGDASNLPFPDNYFDSVGISFATRNLTYKNPHAARHLSEVLRVLKPGGRFVSVESSQPRNRIVRSIDHYYLRIFVYRLGWWISRNKVAYNYLTSSAKYYYSPEELRELLLKTGFKIVTFRRLFFGAAAIHVAIK